MWAATVAVVVAVTVAASVPVVPERGQARGWLVEELADEVYDAARPGLFERVVSWILERLQGLELPEGPQAGVSLVVVLAILALVVLIALRIAGPVRLRGGRGRPDSLFGETSMTADEHREAADAHAAEGRWELAVRERFRAVVRALEERTLLDPRPGRTADEAAREAGELLPDVAAQLTDAAALFDDVVYGEREADAASHARVQELDVAVAGARPVFASSP